MARNNTTILFVGGCAVAAAAAIVVAVAAVVLPVWLMAPKPATEGLQLVFDVELGEHIDSDQRSETMDEVGRVFDERLAGLGLAESWTTVSDDQVTVWLEGDADASAVIPVLSSPGALEFRAVDDSIAEQELARIIAQGSADTDLPAGRTVAYQAIDAEPGQPATAIPLLLRDRVWLDNGHIASTAAELDPFDQPNVMLTFTAAGSDAFCQMTDEFTGERVAILLDGEVLSAPKVQEKICGGQAQISPGRGSLEDNQADCRLWAAVLGAAALPAPVTLAVQTVFGPGT